MSFGLAEARQFVVSNYADVSAVLVSVMVLGYVWKLTSAIFAPFVILQHNVTDGSSGHYQYAPGPSDPLLVAFILGLVIVAHDILREYFWEKIAKKFHMPKQEQPLFVIEGNYFFGGLAIISLAYYSIKEDGILSGYSSIWASYPFHSLSMSSKLFALVTVAYWLHLFIVLPVLKVPTSEGKPWITAALAHIVAIVSAYIFGFTPLVVLLSLVHTTASILSTLHSMLSRLAARVPPARPGRPEPLTPLLASRLEAIVSVAKRVAAVVIVIITAHVLGVKLSEAPGMDLAAFNVNHIAVRAAAGVVIVAAALVPFLRK